MTAFPREVRDLDHVWRWGVVRVNHRQNVSSHSFYVAIYAQTIAELIGWRGDLGSLLTFAIHHDMPEIMTGDIIGPAKHSLDKDKLADYESAGMMARFGRDLSSLHDPFYQDRGVTHYKGVEEIKLIVEAADKLDQLFYLAVEIQMGNGTVEVYFQQAEHRARDAWMKLPCCTLPVLEDLWRRHVVQSLRSHRSEPSRPILYPGISREALSPSK